MLVPALIASVGMAAAAGLIYLNDPPNPVLPAAPRNTLAPPPPAPSAFGWRLTGAASHERAMVLEVETTRMGEAVAIAQQLTGPYTDRLDEVLVFFFDPDANPRRAALRVQWTRAHGYRTLALRTPQ